MICPSDTPDGESCGLVKTLALLTHITTEENEESVIKLLIDLGIEDICHLSPDEYHQNYLVNVNGNIIGICNQPFEMAHLIRMLRRKGKISEYISVWVDDRNSSLNICRKQPNLA